MSSLSLSNIYYFYPIFFISDTLEKKIREQYEEIISSHEVILKTKWEDRLQEEVKKTVDLMTKKYLTQLDQQQEKLIQIFQTELK